MISLNNIKRKAVLRPANLFFVELIIVLLFFSFSAAVILQVFAAADERQRISSFTEKSVICAQSIAEVYSVSASLNETFCLVFGNEIIADDAESAVVYLDENLTPSLDADICLKFEQAVEESAAGYLYKLDMSFVLDDEEIYAVTCYAYQSSGGVFADG